ncbi:hypothetical protein [Canibacter oris]|uniref:Tetratricopeptide repeat protein n=1 Tax=Canibacter oris TaxID=1365628 RepID=A0A840DGV9_9MICO|nr:hypothetical protein [Canibacter oris]MBB4070933.1 hypothetical protein [Canibacter oris]
MKERNFSDRGGRDKKQYGAARGAEQGQRRSDKQWQPRRERGGGEQRREFGRAQQDGFRSGRDGFRGARGERSEGSRGTRGDSFRGGRGGGAERYVKRDRAAGAPRRGEDFKRDSGPRRDGDKWRRDNREGGQRRDWREQRGAAENRGGRREQWQQSDRARHDRAGGDWRENRGRDAQLNDDRRDFRRDGKRDFRRDERRDDNRNFRRGSGDFKRDDNREFKRDGNRDFKRDGSRDSQREFNRGDRFERRGGRAQDRDFGRGGTRGAGRSDRGGRERTFSEAERIAHELRPVRAAHIDPEIPDEVLANQLQPSARNELKTLEKDNADRVARHLVMVRELIHIDPELAHQHAISASRRAGRIPVARETLAITAYALGDFAMALREYRTWRRLTGRDDHIAFMVDCERGLGRPEKGLELAAQVDPADIPHEARVHLAIAVSGARLDMGQPVQARAELEIPQLDPRKAYPFSPELFRAYAAVLEELGDAAATEWENLADRAEAALLDSVGGDELLVTDAMASDAELAERGIALENMAPQTVTTAGDDTDSAAVDTTAAAESAPGTDGEDA